MIRGLTAFCASAARSRGVDDSILGASILVNVRNRSWIGAVFFSQPPD